jgi:alpha-tubulin suppressor-like RCC1 family protein
LGTADRRKSIDMSSLQSVQDEGRIHESVVPNLEDVVELVAGARFTCAVTKARSLFCWGANGFGQLGLGRTSSAEPTPALTLENVRVVGAGAEHACAVTTDGRVLCWGKASEAQLARAPTERCGSGDCQPTPSPATPW